MEAPDCRGWELLVLDCTKESSPPKNVEDLRLEHELLERKRAELRRQLDAMTALPPELVDGMSTSRTCRAPPSAKRRSGGGGRRASAA